jgi:formate-dependent phosphoribosylglycinamide formyltransferase (EC 6.3.4.-)
MISDASELPACRERRRRTPRVAAYNAGLPAPENPMKPFGTPHTDHALRVLLLGAGELGKEVAIELQRYAVEVIAVDRYAHAPAMQVAHRSHVSTCSMARPCAR